MAITPNLNNFRAQCDALAAWDRSVDRVRLEAEICRANLRRWNSPAERSAHLAPFVWASVEAKTLIELRFGVTL